MLHRKDDRLTTAQIAELVGVNAATIRGWHATGRHANDLKLYKGRGGRIWAFRPDVERFAAIYWGVEQAG
jgi:hypothetical protein